MDILDEYLKMTGAEDPENDEEGGLASMDSGLETMGSGLETMDSGLETMGSEDDEDDDLGIESLEREARKELEEEEQQGLATDGGDDVDAYLSLKEQESDNIAAAQLSTNAIGYTNTGTPIGMNPATAPPEGFIEAENKQYDTQIAVEDAQNKVDEYNAQMVDLRARKMRLQTEASAVATALGSAMMNVGVSSPDPNTAKKLVGTEDKKLQARINEIDRRMEQVREESQPYREELRLAKDNMYGELFKGEDGQLMSAGDAARKVRESKESIDKEIEKLKETRKEWYNNTPPPEERTEEWRAETSNKFEEMNATIEHLEMLRKRLDPVYADVYMNTEAGTPASSDWSGEVEQVGLLEDPIFNLTLMYPGIKLGNTLGREAVSALTYGGADVAAIAGKGAIKGAQGVYKGMKYGAKGLKYGAKGGWKGIKQVNPQNMKAAAQLLGRGAKATANKAPEAVKLSGKAIYESPSTLLKFGKNIKYGVGNLIGSTGRGITLSEEFAKVHPQLSEWHALERAGKVAFGDVNPNEVAAAYTQLLRGSRPGKGATEFLVGEKAARGIRKTKLAAKHVLVDRSAAMKEILNKTGEAGKDAIRRFEMQAGTPTYAKMRVRNAQRLVNEGLSQDEKEMVDHLIFARSELASEDYLIARSSWDEATLHKLRKNLEERGSQVPHPGGYTRADLESVIDTIEDKVRVAYGDNANEVLAKIHDRADRFFAESRKVLDDMYNPKTPGENILSKEQYESLAKHRGEFAPRIVTDMLGEANYVGIKGQPMSIKGPGFMKTFGTERQVVLDNKSMLDQMISGVVERQARAATNRSLYNAAQTINEMEEAKGLPNSVVRILQKKPKSHMSPAAQKRLRRMVDAEELSQEDYDEIMEHMWTSQFEKLGKDETFVGTMIDGEQVGMGLKKEFAEQWSKGDPYIANEHLNWLQWISLTRPLKIAATMYNPAFAVRNIMRDMQHAYMVTPGLYNSFLPVGFSQMTADYARTFKDAWRWDKGKSKRYMDALKDGLGMDFLAGSSALRPRGYEHKSIETIANVFGYVGESSEVWTRLAVRERGVRKFMKAGKNYEEASRLATYQARNYLDFSQHGSIMHTIDSFVPYANAAMQASRGLGRAAQQDPSRFAFKVAQIMGTHALWYNHLRNSHPELYNSLSDYERDNYMIFPASFLAPKKDGNDTRYPYFRIALDQQARPFTAMAEMMMDAIHGREVDPMKGVNAAKGVMAIQPDLASMPPLIKILVEYNLNQDTWRNEEIWKGRNVEPEMEKTKYTSPLAVDFGEATGMSPVRLEHVAGSMTGNNFFLDTLGLSGEIMKKHLSEKERREASEIMINDIPGIKDVLRYSNPKARKNDNYDQLEKEANAYYLQWSREISRAMDENENIGDAYMQIRKTLQQKGTPYEERQRIMENMQKQAKAKRLGYDTDEWREIIHAGSSLLRAKLLWRNYSELDKESRQEFLRDASRVGVMTGKTRRIFYKIKRNDGETPDEYDF